MNERREQIDYLTWIIKEYGREQPVTQTNCNNNPIGPHDYSFYHGKAGELLDRIESGGELISWH